MPIDKRVADAAEALTDVSDGATVFISGFGGAGFPNVLIRALRDRRPKGLTLVVNSATHRYSYTHELIEAGLVRKVVCTAARGHSKAPSAFERKARKASASRRRLQHSAEIHSRFVDKPISWSAQGASIGRFTTGTRTRR